MSHLFSEFTLTSPSGPLSLANRAIVAPMCQYSATHGQASDWHLMHWGNMLNSGAAMFIIEATAVVPEGRITPMCLGLWDDATAAALQDKLHRARQLAPKVPVCIQLAHAGRKASSAVPWQGGQLLRPEQGGWSTEGPSPIPHLAQETAPHELDAKGFEHIKQAFAKAAQRAEAMGIEAIELHGAHGYLLHQFLSPVANHRTDSYGGNFDNRTRFPMEVFEAVRAVYKGTLGMRISASDWVDNGWTPEETADFSLRLKLAGADFVHISSGGVAAQQKIALGPDYQVPFAKLVKQKTNLPTITVGLITEPQQAEDILARGDADLIALARAFLYKPRWVWEAAAALHGTVQASPQYWRCMPREAQGIFDAVQMGQR
ncbi:oxidoreductase [Limnohabitans curvus]|uniref:Oxidoreductase n=1 Tax=Limnohabitans curvus TaxID=323423 RepID=A0A315EPV0_9BURK|nr:NADH:flavin oxidoreductase/NADH oxidase [Limnohabitans curvus]PUE58858.1 oxidoreductase [Limnohabitans curvus]